MTLVTTATATDRTNDGGRHPQERINALRVLLTIKPDIPLDEKERIAALKRYRILDTPAEVSQTPRSESFCARAILRPSELMVVEDAARDP